MNENLKMSGYDRLFVFIVEEGERNHILPITHKITVFHEFFKLFRSEFVSELDFQEFVKEEFKQFKNQ